MSSSHIRRKSGIVGVGALVTVIAFVGLIVLLRPEDSGPEHVPTDRIAGPSAVVAEPTLEPADAFGSDDIARTGLSVEPVADTAGLLSREEALAVALENFNPPDPDVRVDPYLFKATSPGSLGSDQPIRDLAVWIVRYSNLTIHSPSGVELHWAYSIFDAATGTYLGGNWAR